MTWNIPNILTLSRVFLIPIVLLFYLNGWFWPAFFVLIFAMLTDYFDGYFARKLNQETQLGAILDPIADKIVAIAYYSFIWIEGLSPFWFCALVLFRNISQILCIPVLVFWLKREFFVKPKKFAKWGTALSDIYVFIPLFLVPLIPEAEKIGHIYIYVMAIFEIWIVVTYWPRLIQIALKKHDTFE